MNEIKVSVIIPIYNVEAYVEECIISVQKQTLVDIEIVCVNDGTQDGSLEIVKRIARNDTRIKIVDKDNGGLSSARNAGLAEAKGQYIIFLDSDDYILPETLEELYAQASQYHLDFISFDAYAFYDVEEVKDECIGNMQCYSRKKDYCVIYNGMELFSQMYLSGDFIVSACLQLVKRTLLMDNQITFYEGIIHEDILFCLQLAIISQKVMYKKKAYYMRRIRKHSIMTTKQEIRSAYGIYVSLLEVIKFSDLKGINKYNSIITEDFLLSGQLAGMNKLRDRKIRQELSYKEIFQTLSECPVQHVVGMMLWIYEAERMRESEVELAKKENNLLKNSISYKLGLAITYVPRRTCHLIMQFAQNMRYGLCSLLPKVEHAKICVSIIIPVYNANEYLRECLESLLKQTLKNIEIIGVNDGSTDDSLEILKEYARKDKRITVVDQDNQGAGSARNNGLSYAKGEYILFLDSDDYFNPRLCELAYYNAKSRRAQICLFKADGENVKTGKIESLNHIFVDNEIPKKVFSALDVREKIFQITTGCPWSKIFEHAFINQYHIQFQNIKNANDVLFVRTACALADKITAFRGEPLVTYRYNSETSTQGRKSKAPLEFFLAFKELKMQLIENGRYQYFEKSFVNMVLEESLYNYKTVNSIEVRTRVRESLVKEIFPYFEFEKYGSDFFYNYKSYEEYREMVLN